MNLNTNKESQDSKTDTVLEGTVLVGVGRVNEEHKGEGIWWVEFIAIYEKKGKLQTIASRGAGRI
jgi:hypothetical protein